MTARLPSPHAAELSVSALRRHRAILDAITAALTEAFGLNDVLRRALTTVMEITGVNGGGIFLIDDRTGEIRLTVHHGVSERLVASYAADPGATVRALATDPNATLIVRDVALRQHRSVLTEEGIRSYAGIPLQVRGRSVGVLVVVSRSQSDFNSADVELLVSIGRQIGFAIEHARLYEESIRSVRQARAFQEVATAITASLDLPTTLERVLDAAMSVFDADRAALYMIVPGTRRMHCPAARNLSPAYLAAVQTYYDTHEWPSSLDDQRSVYVADAWSAHLTPELSEAVRREGFRSMLYLPLPNGADRLGTLVLYHDEVRAYSEQEIALAQTFADQANIAIRHARLFEAERRAREQASTILEATRAVTSSLRMEEVLTEAGGCIASALRQRACGIWLLNDEGSALIPTYRIADRPNPALDEVFRSLPPLVLDADPRLRAMIENRQPLVVDRPEELSEAERYVQQRLPFHIYVAIPLAARDRVVGAAAVPVTDRRSPPEAADIEVAMAVARSTALAVENARLHEQSQQLAISEERNRLARELHDSVTHSLFSMTLISQALPTLLERDINRARERIDRLNELGRGALAEMRALIFQLRPATLEEHGLVAALTRHTAAFESREGITVNLRVSGERRLPPAVEEAIFRVAQEALNNVVKHAQATAVEVQLTITETIAELMVTDNGQGFDPSAPRPSDRRSLGLIGMRERAVLLHGACSVDSAPGQGTTVRLLVPLTAGL